MIRRREFLIGAASSTVGFVTSSRAVGSSQAQRPDPNFHVSEVVHADQQGAAAGMNTIIAELPNVVATST